MSEPLLEIPVGIPLERTALDAIAIHLHNGCVFQPVFRPLEIAEGPNGESVVTAAVLVSVQLVQPMVIPVASPEPASPEEIARLKAAWEEQAAGRRVPRGRLHRRAVQH